MYGNLLQQQQGNNTAVCVPTLLSKKKCKWTFIQLLLGAGHFMYEILTATREMGTISHFTEEKITDQSSIIGPTQLLHGGGRISCYFLYQAFPAGKKESVYPPSNLKQWGWHSNNYELVSTFPNSPKPTLLEITQFNLPGP